LGERILNSGPRNGATGLLAVVIVAVSCSLQSDGPSDPPDDTVASVEVSPANATLTSVGATQQFTATARNASNSAIAGQTFTWTSSSPGVATVDTSGLAAAVAHGTTTIVAAAAGKQDSAAVTVALPPEEVASVEVIPASATLSSVGATQQFVATARTASNAVIPGQKFTWSSSSPGVATVDTNGLATAVANGTTSIVAATSGKQDTVTVTVALAPAPTLLMEETFENASLAARGWYDLPSGGITSITTAEHVAGSTASLEAHFNTGDVYPTPRVFARHLFAETEAVYIRFWVKYSANWAGSGQPYHPHEFLIVTNEDTDYVGPSRTFLTLYVEHNYQNGGIALLAAQDGKNIDTTKIGQDLTNVTENRAIAGCNGNSDGTPGDCYQSGGLWNNGKKWTSAGPVFLPNPGAGFKGDWHQVEVYFKLNSIQNGVGQLDGKVQYWFDGNLVIDKQNALLRTGSHPNMRIEQFILGPYIGDGSPVTQSMWIDNLVVMTGKP